MHSVKSGRIRSYSGPRFSEFGLNTERYSYADQDNADQDNSEYGDAFYAVMPSDFKLLWCFQRQHFLFSDVDFLL